MQLGQYRLTPLLRCLQKKFLESPKIGDILRFLQRMVFANFATSCNTYLSVHSFVSCYCCCLYVAISLVNIYARIIYYAYRRRLQYKVSYTYDRLGRFFRFVFIYAW